MSCQLKRVIKCVLGSSSRGQQGVVRQVVVAVVVVVNAMGRVRLCELPGAVRIAEGAPSI